MLAISECTTAYVGEFDNMCSSLSIRVINARSLQRTVPSTYFEVWGRDK